MKKSDVTIESALPKWALPLSETVTVCPDALPRAIDPLLTSSGKLTQSTG
jgi:hypothetical protein